MKKQCVNCGAELPAEASFCPYCAQSLIEKQKISPPKPTSKRLKSLIVLFAVIFLTLSLSLLQRSNIDAPEKEDAMAEADAAYIPQDYEGGAELRYKAENGETYHLALSFNGHNAGGWKAEEITVTTLSSQYDGEYSKPSQLYVYKGGNPKSVTSEFMELVEDISVESYPHDGAWQMSVTDLAYEPEAFPHAARVSNVRYNINCGTNAIHWVLTMKNGDTITLAHRLMIKPLNAVEYHWEDTPMNTLEELQALLDQIDREMSRSVVAYIYLPPVTYEGGLTISNRAYNFYGSVDGDQQTTFTDTVTIGTKYPEMATMKEIRFEGNGGVGIDSQAGVFLYDCYFSGWEIGAAARDQGWLQSNGCTYVDNNLGLLFDCADCSHFGPDYPDNYFENNQTALEIRKVHNKRTLTFPNTMFRNNGTDISNPAQHPVDLSETIFE